MLGRHVARGCVLIRENDCQFSVELGTGAETGRRGYGEALASVALVRSGSGAGGGSVAETVTATGSADSVHEDSRFAVVAMAWARPRISKPTMQTPGRRSGYGSRGGRGCPPTRGPDGAPIDSETPIGIEGPASRHPLGRGPRTGAGRPARAARAGRGRPAGWAGGLTALATDAPRPGLQGWVSYAESGGVNAEKLEIRVIS